ncbi:thioesterase superfamily protein [bacterium BMS3Bbin07]|nr:thioesterase superfamily protein [bacterium BMS3Bbin07]
MEFTDNGACFVCGKTNPSGLRLDFSMSNGHASATYLPDKIHQGYRDILHGGLISTLIDEAAVKAASSLGIKAITVEICVRFKTPLMIGERCMVEASAEPVRGRLIEGVAVVKKMDGTIVAEGHLKLFRT